MSDTCVECGNYVRDGQGYFNNGAARALIPFAGRLMSDGPFCSKGCKRDYLAAKEAGAEKKALKKEAKALGISPGAGYDAGDLKEQRKILELQKEEREAEETRIRQEKEAEEVRIRQGKAATLHEKGYRTRSFLLHNQNALLGAGFGYLFATYLLSIFLGPKGHPAGWVWAVSGVVFCVTTGLVIRNIVRENAAVKSTRY